LTHLEQAIDFDSQSQQFFQQCILQFASSAENCHVCLGLLLEREDGIV
jgi:hypothetical protein